MFLKKDNKFRKFSYSQSGEDLIVKYIFNTLGNYKPSYMDIGAHHPFSLSNTALLYENGSTGINIEPDPNLFVTFKKYRKQDINLNVGIHKEEGVADFYIISSPTLSTFSKAEANKLSSEGDYKIKKIVKVKVTTIQKVVDTYSRGKFPDFLSIDAEGIDEIIIKQIDFTSNFPIVICIETISFSMSGHGIKNFALIDFLERQGYLMYADTNINTIFVRKDTWER